MSDQNSTVLIGRVTKDAEVKYTPSGTAVCKFSIANGYRKKSNDQWTDEVNYFEVSMFGKIVESIGKYLTKGRQVCVKGELRQERWQEQGNNRSKILVLASTIQLLSAPGQKQGDQASNESNQVEAFEDDVPF